jgi:hypothetical protein
VARDGFFAHARYRRGGKEQDEAESETQRADSKRGVNNNNNMVEDCNNMVEDCVLSKEKLNVLKLILCVKFFLPWFFVFVFVLHCLVVVRAIGRFAYAVARSCVHMLDCVCIFVVFFCFLFFIFVIAGYSQSVVSVDAPHGRPRLLPNQRCSEQAKKGGRSSPVPGTRKIRRKWTAAAAVPATT